MNIAALQLAEYDEKEEKEFANKVTTSFKRIWLPILIVLILLLFFAFTKCTVGFGNDNRRFDYDVDSVVSVDEAVPEEEVIASEAEAAEAPSWEYDENPK